MQRIWACLICLATAYGGMAFAAESQEPTSGADRQEPTLVVQMDENRGSWTSDASPQKKGGQNLVYYSIGYYASRWGVTVLGSHGDTAYINNDISKGDFHHNGMMDSIISAYYLRPSLLGLDVRFGLDLNVPTGRPSFNNGDLGAMMLDGVSKDLNLATSFGRGLNIAPNIILSRSFEHSSIGLGLRYEMMGEYDPTSEVPDDNLKPGDMVMLMGVWQYAISARDMLITDLVSTMSGRDQQGGAEVFKKGNTYDITVRYVKAGSSLRVTYAFAVGLQDKNKTLGTGGGLATEDRNTNNNRIEGFINTGYAFGNRMMLNNIFGYKKFDANGYSSGDQLYDAGYDKIYAGGGVTYTFSESSYVKLDVRAFQIYNGADAMEPSSTVYRGANIDIGFVYLLGGGKGQ